jgi:protein-tyrosine-phosphatase
LWFVAELLRGIYMNSAKVNVLFVSRRNTIRSVIAQSCLAHLSKGRFNAYSCGVPNEVPTGLNSVASETLDKAGLSAAQENCVGWERFTRNNSPRMHWVIVLDKDVKRMEPDWPGQPESALWDYPDILVAEKDAESAHVQASKLLISLYGRIEILTNLPLNTGDRIALRSDIRDLGYSV